MPPAPPPRNCPHCGRGDFVRYEQVVKGDKAHLHYYCGACEWTWEQEQTSDTGKRPDPRS